MDVNDVIRVVDPGPLFYHQMSMQYANPFRLGKIGVVRKYAMNKTFEPGWLVEFNDSQKHFFFYEEELLVLEGYEDLPPEPDKDSMPSWAYDPEAMSLKIFQVLHDEDTFREVFGRYFKNMEEVHQHYENLLRGEL